MTKPTRVEIRPDYTPHARAERLIAAGRFVLAFFSLVAVYLEPSTPAQFQRATYSLLVVYTFYALATVLFAWRSPVPSARWRLVSHALDLILFSLFVYLTEGPASPFFLYFVFSLFCATLRFTWRGILATGLAAMAVYAAMAIVAAHSDPSFESSHALIREAYLAVIAALLVYLGVYQQRLRIELASLAAWPRELASRMEDLLRSTLAHAASVVDARRVLLVWEENEEPWMHTALWTPDELRLDRVAPRTFEPLGEPALRNRSFFVRAPRDPILAYDPANSNVHETSGAPLGEMFRKRFAIESAIAVSLESETITAHFVIPDVRSATTDDLALAHIAGRLVLGSIEQFFFVQQVRQTASGEERLRISRELHDGIVQSLAGVALHLQAVQAKLAPDAANELAYVLRVIEHDQRELRTLVRELRPHDSRDGNAIVSDELQRMRERFLLEWGLDVEVDLAATIDVSPRLAHELCRIVNESLANAAKHGEASRVVASLAAGDGFVRVHVADNGRGFPFTGRFDLRALEQNGSGPRTLKERVAALGGEMTIDSSTAGATIDIRIPLAQETLR